MRDTSTIGIPGGIGSSGLLLLAGGGFSAAPIRAAAPGFPTEPTPASGAIQLSHGSQVPRAVDVLLANDEFFRGGEARLLANPPAGCNP